MESEYKLGMSFFTAIIVLFLTMMYLLVTQDSETKVIRSCDAVGMYIFQGGKAINCKVLKSEKE